MIRLKVLSTFFQTSEITTMIKISWPPIAFFAMPFKLAVSDAECFGSDGSGTLIYVSFFVYVWLPTLVFALMFLVISCSPRGSDKRQALSTSLIFLAMLWYTPVLQMVGSMYDCFEDLERLNDDGYPQHFLVADSDLNCNPSGIFKFWRNLIHINSLLIVVFVGLGFPAAIYYKVKQLKRNNKLTADSSFASLYQYYTPDMPFFEVVHMIRKALLILFMSTLATHPIAQAVLCFIVNAGFVAILWRTKLLIFFPCTLIKNQNLYLLSEVLGACVTLAGSFLALVGAVSQGAVNVLGTIFAVINISFTVLFFCGFHVDMLRSKEDKKSLLRRGSVASNTSGERLMPTSLDRKDSLKKKLDQSVKAAEEEWDNLSLRWA
ncbi:hypothetical protein TrVE_jg1186 [Triparma verrucosa]|uniref:Uncharacterized protein n=2 Tax=Triparma verrucosa TaxID=1606542 RepID=A0A9W7BWY8_9STRA|nr:hypothetical protein TrVE_jg1186 [Triparma verrucosa]